MGFEFYNKNSQHVFAGRLEEIREQNKGHANLDYAKMLEEYREAENLTAKQQEDADEAFVQ